MAKFHYKIWASEKDENDDYPCFGAGIIKASDSGKAMEVVLENHFNERGEPVTVDINEILEEEKKDK